MALTYQRSMLLTCALAMQQSKRSLLWLTGNLLLFFQTCLNAKYGAILFENVRMFFF